MTARELNIKLVSAIPEIEEEYRECVSGMDGDDTGAHVVYGSVLVPYIIRLANGHCISKLKTCMQFIEKVLSWDDLYSEDVIAVSVIEYLAFSEELKFNVYSYLGPKSKKIYDEIKKKN